jgi:hypothetical protein
VALLYSGYLMLAWYDYFYSCQRHLGVSALAHFYAPFKPADSVQIIQYNHWDPGIRARVLAFDLLVLAVLLALAPWFLAWNPK